MFYRFSRYNIPTVEHNNNTTTIIIVPYYLSKPSRRSIRIRFVGVNFSTDKYFTYISLHKVSQKKKKKWIKCRHFNCATSLICLFLIFRLIREGLCDRGSAPSISAISRLLRGHDGDDSASEKKVSDGKFLPLSLDVRISKHAPFTKTLHTYAMSILYTYIRNM